MSFIKNLNKKLNKMFDGQVVAQEEGGCLILSGELEQWNDVVLAGLTAVEKNPYFGFVNSIECTKEKGLPLRTPRLEDSALEWEEPDVLIIGGGVIGCAIARELSKFKLSVMLVEKEHDVAVQTSGRNMGLIHSGAGIRKGTEKHRFSRLGNPMFENLCADLGVDFNRSGQFAYLTKRLWDPFLFLSSIYWKWHGIKDVRVVKSDELHSLEPAVSKDIGAALYFPMAGVISPFELTVAYAENAVQNGVTISFDTIVESIVTEDGFIKSVITNRGTIQPKLVVNAAGLFCENIAAMAGDRFYSIRPRKGTIAVLDRKYSKELIHTALTPIGKTSGKKKHIRGCSIVRSIGGNVLVGPDSFETVHKEDYSTSPLNINEIFKSQTRIVPNLNENQVITYFSGINAVTYTDDFIVTKGKYVGNIVHAAGIQLPGLTAAPAIGLEVAQIVVDHFGGEGTVGENPDYNPKRSAPPRPSKMTDTARAELIETNPDYGIIICKCEEVSKGEILYALRRDLKCYTLDGLKRRVRVGMGRCQGSHCAPLLVDIIAADKRLPLQNVRKSGGGSEKLYGISKTQIQKKSTSVTRLSDSELKSNAETTALLHKKALELQAAKDNERKDSVDDDI